MIAISVAAAGCGASEQSASEASTATESTAATQTSAVDDDELDEAIDQQSDPDTDSDSSDSSYSSDSDAETAGASAADSAAVEPFRIVVAGDSMMGGLYPAIEAALEGNPDRPVEVDYVLTPGIVENPEAPIVWDNVIADTDPDLSIFLLGWWENFRLHSGTLDISPNQDDWVERYREETVEPWRELVTSAGSDLIWLTMPPVDDAERSQQMTDLNHAWSSIADGGSSQVVDTSPAITDPAGGYLAETSEAGRTVQLRNPDGLHLCPAGAVAMTTLLLDTLAADQDLVAIAGWEDGPWTTNEAYPVNECEPRSL